MIHVLIISDFTESFSHKLLAGLVDYSRRKEQWIVRRMPPEYKRKIGIPGVIHVAKDWDIDAVIGQFEPTEDVSLFAENGIVAIAQDYKKRFNPAALQGEVELGKDGMRPVGDGQIIDRKHIGKSLSAGRHRNNIRRSG